MSAKFPTLIATIGLLLFTAMQARGEEEFDASVGDSGVEDLNEATDAGLEQLPLPAPEKTAPPEGGREGAPTEGAFETEASPFDDDWSEQDNPTGTAIRVHGSYENQLNGWWLQSSGGKEKIVLYDSNRLRIDVDADLGKGIEIRANGVARIFAGETEFALLDLIPPATYKALLATDPRWAMLEEEPYRLENDYYLDNAYIKLPIGNALLTIGKQPLEQGAGYVWNPTDVFTRKDMFDPTYEKPGIVGARLLVPLGDAASIDIIGVPHGNYRNWTGGGRGSVRVGPLSMSVVSFITKVEQTDMESSLDLMIAAALQNRDPEEAIQKSLTQRVLVGGDVIADIAGIRFWTEGAYNFIKGKPGAPENWWELGAGFEYYFPFETHLMAEYFHYGRSPNQQKGIYSLDDWIQLLAGETKMLGRDFLFESVDHPVSDFWTVGISSFQAIGDASAVIMADVRYAFAEDAELWFVLSANLGERSDFLSSSRGQGWLRLKAYF